NLAAKAALDATVGDEIDQKNEEAAIALVARWKGIDSTKIAQLNEEDKARHANGEEDVPFEGSTDVVGVKYLIESVEQAALGGVGKAVSRTLGVVGSKTSNNSILADNKTVAQFERELAFLPPGERVAQIKAMAAKVVSANGMLKDSKLSKLNGRDVYLGKDGNLYALDSQHGRFEIVNAKNGKHLGEVDFGMNQTKSADGSGRHDLEVK
ncbi:colicin E3/pyocin S6 family cytotoxin, partial [Pseudomonas abietaniphila]